jgi:hypothetical protein
MHPTTWRKSSYSESAQGSCVEVAFSTTSIAVRDSKNAPGPTLTFAASTWRNFLTRAPW